MIAAFVFTFWINLPTASSASNSFVLPNSQATALTEVNSLDLERNAGKWYEIARFSNRFQKKCLGNVTSTYSIFPKYQIKVLSESPKNDGTINTAEGRAKLANPQSNEAKLKVRFAPAFFSWLPIEWADYWILLLSPDYQYAVVGTPDRQYLWFLSRSSRMNEPIYQELLQKIKDKGFDVTKLVKTLQK